MDGPSEPYLPTYLVYCDYRWPVSGSHYVDVILAVWRLSWTWLTSYSTAIVTWRQDRLVFEKWSRCSWLYYKVWSTAISEWECATRILMVNVLAQNSNEKVRLTIFRDVLENVFANMGNEEAVCELLLSLNDVMSLWLLTRSVRLFQTSR